MIKKLSFTPDELARYFNGQEKHKAYQETVDMAYSMRIHAEGLYPKSMIEERRPSESASVKAYREKIFQPITKPIVSKVFTELNKIRRSAEWGIKYNASKVPPRIAEEETLEVYCEKKFPFFGSVTNWVFKVLLPQYLKDANAVVAVMPLSPELPQNEYVQPFGFTFGSENIYGYEQDNFAVIKSTDKVVYTNAQGTKWYGEVFFVFTTQLVQRWEQTNGEKRWMLKWEYPHGIGQLPVFRVDGLIKKILDQTFVFETRLHAMLPRLNEALREYTDLQAEVVQHIFNEKWEMISDDCPRCKGKAKVRVPGFTQEETDCQMCEGTGHRQKGPYSKYQVKMPMAGETLPPMPPAGVIEKNVEIVRIQDDRIEKHIFHALSAINMEYLHDTPLNQSGTAKEVDKDALNNFVSAVAEDIVATMDRLYFFICEYRYLMVLPNPEQRRDLLPFIAVPEKFDLLSASYLEERIAKQKENGGNPIIITAMEEDYANKKFAGDDLLQQRVMLSLRLDPLAGLSEDDKMTRLSNKGITEETYVISCNIRDFIDQAIEETGDAFFTMSRTEQKKLMSNYASALVKANSAAAKVLSIFPAEAEKIDPAQQEAGKEQAEQTATA
jgi:hypothetical protein